MVRVVAAQGQGLPDQGREILPALLVGFDVPQSRVAHHGGGVHPVGVAGPGRHQAVGGKEDGGRDVFKLLLLALPGCAEITRQLGMLFQLRIAVGRQHLAVGVDIDPQSVGLLQQLVQVLQVVAGHHDEGSLFHVHVHPCGDRRAEGLCVGPVQQGHALEVHLAELHDKGQPFLHAVLLPQGG